MTWQSVGTHTFVPTDKAVQVGEFDLAAGQDTIWVKITQLNNPGDWPWSYGILSWRNANGTPLGSIKAYSNRLGEVFRLGNGLPPSDGTGSIWFEPRGFNLGWLKAGFPWELQFEAQAGASHMTSGYWNRDPVNSVLSPVTLGDNVQSTGNLDFTSGAFSASVSVGGADTPEAAPSVNLSSNGSLRARHDADKWILLAGSDQWAIQVRSGGAYSYRLGWDGQVGFALDPSTALPRISFSPTGVAEFSSDVYTNNLIFRSSDPAFRSADQYVGPELSLLDEIVRLEALVQNLYDKLRMTPPAGWDVWDGDTDLVKSRGKKKGQI